MPHVRANGRMQVTDKAGEVLLESSTGLDIPGRIHTAASSGMIVEMEGDGSFMAKYNTYFECQAGNEQKLYIVLFVLATVLAMGATTMYGVQCTMKCLRGCQERCGGKLASTKEHTKSWFNTLALLWTLWTVCTFFMSRCLEAGASLERSWLVTMLVLFSFLFFWSVGSMATNKELRQKRHQSGRLICSLCWGMVTVLVFVMVFIVLVNGSFSKGSIFFDMEGGLCACTLYLRVHHSFRVVFVRVCARVRGV